MPHSPEANVPSFDVPLSKLAGFLKLLHDEQLRQTFLEAAPDVVAHPTSPLSHSSSNRMNAEIFSDEKSVKAGELASLVDQLSVSGGDVEDRTIAIDARLVEFAKIFVEQHELGSRWPLARSLQNGDCEKLGMGRDCR